MRRRCVFALLLSITLIISSFSEIVFAETELQDLSIDEVASETMPEGDSGEDKSVPESEESKLEISEGSSSQLTNNEALSSDYGINNPVSGGTFQSKWGQEDYLTTWDCIWFGKYYKTDNETRKPIKWRVLSVNGDDAFLLSDVILDYQVYGYVVNNSVPWETCELRNWLNNEFYNTAFSEEEKSAIKTSYVVNGIDPTYNVDGGNDTYDNIYLLSYDDARNEDYGFHDKERGNYDERVTRQSKESKYARSLVYHDELYTFTNYGQWWLRTMKSSGRYTNITTCDEHGWTEGSFSYNEEGVRPCLHIDLSSSAWSYAGTVSSDETVNEVDAIDDDDPVDPIQPRIDPITIHFNANGGTVDKDSKPVYTGEKYGTLPTPKYSDSSYYFAGWYTTKTGGTKISPSTIVEYTKDKTLYARWKPRKSIAKAKVTVKSITYNGQARKPSVTVVLGSKTLTAGTDYKVTYSNNINAGSKAIAKVTGKGKYKGSVSKTFTIKPFALDTEHIKVTLSYTTCTYNGKYHEPGVTVKFDGMRLKKGTDFTVLYYNNKNVGKAKAIVTGKGNFKGTRQYIFVIEKVNQPAKLSPSSLKVTYKEKGKTYKIKYTGRKESAKVSYSSTDNSVATVSKGTVTIKGTGSCIIKVKFAETAHYKSVTRKYKVTVLKKQTIAADIVSNTNIMFPHKPIPLGARVTTGDGKLTYKTSDKSILTVDKNGNLDGIEATKLGTVTITITAAETATYAKATKKIVLTTTKRKPEISCKTEQTHVFSEKPFSIGATVVGSTAQKKTTLTYKTSNKDIATVDSNGIVTIDKENVKKPTTVDVTVSTKPNIFYKAADEVIVHLKITKYNIQGLQSLFPSGKYWNHIVPESESGKNCTNEAYAMSITDKECLYHNKLAHTGDYDCNYFDGGIQCAGFGRLLGYLHVNKKSRVTTWETTSDLSELKTGDVLRYFDSQTHSTYGHTVFVTNVDGDEITVGECNVWIDSDTDAQCLIHWGRKIYKDKIWSCTRYISPDVCSECGYVYVNSEHENVSLKDQSNDWKCPDCGAGKDKFNIN